MIVFISSNWNSFNKEIMRLKQVFINYNFIHKFTKTIIYTFKNILKCISPYFKNCICVIKSEELYLMFNYFLFLKEDQFLYILTKSIMSFILRIHTKMRPKNQSWWCFGNNIGTLSCGAEEEIIISFRFLYLFDGA